MEDILLAVMMLAFFVLGYFAAGRFGKYMGRNYRLVREAPDLGSEDREVYITETEGKSPEKIAEEISAVLESVGDPEDYEIIIRRTDAPV